MGDTPEKSLHDTLRNTLKSIVADELTLKPANESVYADLAPHLTLEDMFPHAFFTDPAPQPLLDNLKWMAKTIDDEIVNSITAESTWMKENEGDPDPTDVITSEGGLGDFVTFTTDSAAIGTATYTIAIDPAVNNDDSMLSCSTSCEFTFEQPVHSVISLYGPAYSLIVEIAQTGEVTLGKDVPPEYAAHEFWNRLAERGNLFQQRVESRVGQLEQENTLLCEQLLEGKYARDDKLEAELEEEQSMRVELQDVLNSVYTALDIPFGDELLVVEYAKQYRAASGRFSFDEEFEVDSEQKQEDPNTAYERAMKIVR